MIVTQIPDGHVWLRITRPHYTDPFDPSFAQRRGGRWNPPGSWPTLYLNEDLATVHAQVRHLFTGRGVEPDDLDDDAPIRLAACTLPGRQRVADVITDAGVDAVGLPSSYPSDADGAQVPHSITQQIGVQRASTTVFAECGVARRRASGTNWPGSRPIAPPPGPSGGIRGRSPPGVTRPPSPTSRTPISETSRNLDAERPVPGIFRAW